MGQYYRAYIKQDNAEFAINASKDDGSKLLEHAFIGSDITDTVMNMLYKKPGQVVWVGDYANSDECENLGFDKTVVWQSNEKLTVAEKHTVPFLCRFIVNHSKMVYIDFFKYLSNCGLYLKNKWDIVIHPLPILTALGCGRGNGDYSGGLPNVNKVGTWAGNLISVANNLPVVCDSNGIPKTLEEFDVVFTENYIDCYTDNIK